MIECLWARATFPGFPLSHLLIVLSGLLNLIFPPSFLSILSPLPSKMKHCPDKTVPCALLQRDIQRLVPLPSDVRMREISLSEVTKQDFNLVYSRHFWQWLLLNTGELLEKVAMHSSPCMRVASFTIIEKVDLKSKKGPKWLVKLSTPVSSIQTI